jgi:hypothetical protein
MDVIRNRRAVRDYTNASIDRAPIENLAGVKRTQARRKFWAVTKTAQRRGIANAYWEWAG